MDILTFVSIFDVSFIIDPQEDYMSFSYYYYSFCRKTCTRNIFVVVATELLIFKKKKKNEMNMDGHTTVILYDNKMKKFRKSWYKYIVQISALSRTDKHS